MADVGEISDRLAKESASGALDTERQPTAAAIPTPVEDLSSLLRSVKAIKQILDEREGRSGSVLDKGMTLRDLLNEGVVTLQIGQRRLVGRVGGSVVVGSPGGADVTVGGGAGGAGYVDPRPILEIPPAPTALTASGAFKNVILEWRLLDYRNHAYVEIWRNTTDNLGTAVQIGLSTANVYADASVTVGATYYYWVRAVNIENAIGPYNAVGGTVAGLLLIGNTDLGPLVVEAENIAAKAVDTTKMTVSDFSTIADNPTFEAGDVGWGKEGQWEIINWPSSAFNGDWVARTITSGAPQALRNTVLIPVVPGDEFYAEAMIACSPYTGGSGAFVRLTGRSSAGTEVATPAGNAVTSTSYSKSSLSYTVPTSPAIATISVEIVSLANSGSVVFADNVRFQRKLTLNHLAANSIAVGTAAIQNGAITNAMIANAAIDNAKIANGTIVTANIGDAQITGAKIADATITTAKIVDLSVTGAKITDATITTAKIADAQVTNAKIANASITNAKINDLSADKINAGGIRGINVNASSHTTKGTYLTSAASIGATSINVHNTNDFAGSGTAIIIDTFNEFVTYTGKTATSLTGLSIAANHTSGRTVVPYGNALVMDQATNEMRFFGDRGDGVVEQLGSVGTVYSGGDSVGQFGGFTPGNSRVGVTGRSYSATGMFGSSTTGPGVFGQSTSGPGLSGTTASGTAGVYGSTVAVPGVYGISTSAAGVYGASTNGTAAGQFVSSGAANGVSASASSGYGAALTGNATRAPLNIGNAYTTPPTNASTGSLAIIQTPFRGTVLCFAVGGTWYAVPGAIWDSDPGGGGA